MKHIRIGSNENTIASFFLTAKAQLPGDTEVFIMK